MLTSFFTALRFLTIVPVPYGQDHDGTNFAQSLYWFPAVGLLVGCGGWLLVQLTTPFLGLPVVSAMLLCYLGGISGFLHLDGLADSGDGLLSARPRQRALEIMKDSRVGAMGVIVLVLTLLLKFAALSTMESAELAVAMLLAPLAGRCGILFSMAISPYARSEGGLGSLFYGPTVRGASMFGGGLLLFCALLLTGAAAFGLLITLVLFLLFFAGVCRKKLGGATGDTLGAACELTEALCLLVLSRSAV